MKQLSALVRRLVPMLPFVLGVALVAPAVRADVAPACGKSNRRQQPPRDGAVGGLEQRRDERAAGGGVVLAGGVASIWLTSRRRGRDRR